MKILLIFVSLAVYLPAYATSPESAIELLNSLNEQNTSRSGEQCFEGNDSSELEECALALCGPAETAAVATVNNANFDFYVKEGVKEKFPELVEPVTKVHQKKKAALEKFITAMKEVQNSPKKELDFSTWDEELSNFGHYAYDEYIEMVTDTSKPRSERITVKLSPPQSASETYLKGLKIYSEAKKKERETNIVSGMLYDFYTTDESQELVKGLWKNFIEAFDRERAKNPDFMKDSASEIDKLRKPDAFEITDSFELGQTYHNIHNLQYQLFINTGISAEPLSFGFDCNSDCKEGVRDYLKQLNITDMLKDLEKKKNDLSIEDNIMNCQANLIQRELKDSDREQFLAHFPETKREFLKKVFANYSSHSRLAFEKYLEEDLNLSFSKPPATADDLIEEIKKEAESTESEVDSTATSLLSTLLNYRDWTDRSQMNAELHACEETGGTAFAAWDAYTEKGGTFEEADADPAKDNIFVSLFTCSHLPQGKGVVTHEMGHALSYAFKNGKLSVESKEEFLKVRSCVTNSYVEKKTLDELNGLHPGDSLYSEEDMADVISFNAIDPEGPVFTCALLQTNKEGTRFKDLSLPNIHPGDSHSSPLMRVLREAIYKKKRLPSSCKQIIEKNKDKFRFTPCT